MTQTECSSCHKSLPMNGTFLVAARVLCGTCAAADPEATGDPRDLARNFDPTMCTLCGTDYGSSVLGKLASGLPVCEACREKVLHRPFPGWVKGSFALLLALAMFAFALNWRFIEAYRNSVRSTRAAQAGDFATAARLMQDAARRVPEAAEFGDAGSFFQGIVFIQQDRDADAVPLLESYVSRHRDVTFAGDLLERARYGAAFDRKDYDAMLLKAQAIAARKPGTFDGAAALASAYACKYALTGQRQFKDFALQNLEAATKLGATAEVADITDRLEHRLATRQILSPAEFKKLFPNGWRRGAGPK
ncbi:MAG TPA: hypothetical protein VN893_15270 [Bryobacteraceae bacterium]|nr:hypothetical protein [Bryobacteraceae bacterium]